MPKLELTVSSLDALDPRRFVVSERLSRPYLVEVWARSKNASIDLDAIVGLEATFRIVSEHPAAPLGGIRELVGRVSEMRLITTEPAGLSTYKISIVPLLALTRLRRNLRLHQDASLPTIVDNLLTEWQIAHEWRMPTADYPVVPLRMQYGESDGAFCDRLLEEAGIAYTFEHKAGGTEVVLSDSFAAAALRPGPIRYYATPNPKETGEYVTAVRVLRRHRPNRVTLTDYDFLRPDTPVRAEAGVIDSRCEWHDYDPHRSVTVGETTGATPAADDRGVYRHVDARLRSEAELTLSALRNDAAAVHFELATVDMWPAMTFEIEGHPELAGQRLVCTEVTIEGTAEAEWKTSCQATFADEPLRPARRTPRPRGHGYLSAIVVGPDKNEIFVDEHGRVRVELAFDRYGKLDEQSSCWLRVSQGWAGAAFGTAFLPRVGQEVLVAFLDGNPDAPVVVGRVYNRGQPAPHKLPELAIRSGIRSATSPGGAGWNEIVLEDGAGEELFFTQAERNARTLVENDAALTTAARRTLQIGTNDTRKNEQNLTQETRKDRIEITTLRRTETTEGESRKKKVVGDQFERIEQSRTATTVKSDHATVAGNRFEQVGLDSEVHTASRIESFGSLSRSVAGGIGIACGEKGEYNVECADADLIAKDDIAMEAPSITLKGAGGFITIDPGGISIKGTIVKINSGGAAGTGAGVGVQKAELPKEALVPEPPKPQLLPAGGLGAEFPKGPEAPVTVKILGASGLGPACPLIPKGKTHTYTAVGTPDGGTFSWSAKGGATIQGSNTLETVTVSGGGVSTAVDAAEVEVAYTVPQGSATDKKKVTVFEITKIEARLRATPCLRTKTRADAMPAKASSKDTKTIDASAVTVIRGSGELDLKAITTPKDVPMTWFVERAADDLAALPGVASHAQAPGGRDGRRLRLDATGSFHVHGFVDCDGDGKRGKEDVGLILNVNIVEATVLPGAQNNRQPMRDSQFSSARSTATHLVVDSGLGVAPAVGYRDPTFLLHAQSAKLGVRLLGGGPDGRRGLREVGLGFLQVASADTFRGTYADGRTVREVLARDAATPDPIVGGAFATMPFPIRDHRGNDRAGYAVFINSSEDDERQNLADGGQKRVVRMIDSPAVVLPLSHPVTGSALARISGANFFKVMASAFTTDFAENFSTLASGTWKAVYGSYTAAGGWSNVRAHVTGDQVLRVHHPIEHSENTAGFERCPPGFTDRLRMDAR
jgi:type VI secretion system secreted protein VgrG